MMRICDRHDILNESVTSRNPEESDIIRDFRISERYWILMPSRDVSCDVTSSVLLLVEEESFHL